MSTAPGIPILGQNKDKDQDKVLEGITAEKLKVGVAEFPVDMEDGHPIVGKVTELHLAVQFRYVLRIPLPLADKKEGAALMDMVMQNGLQPLWENTREALEGMQKDLRTAAAKAVKMEYGARQAEAAKAKDGRP